LRRDSSGGRKKDFAHFLDLAKGSCGEVRSMAYAGEDVGVLAEEVGQQLRAQSEALSNVLRWKSKIWLWNYDNLTYDAPGSRIRILRMV
jgi:hypothetical protein